MLLDVLAEHQHGRGGVRFAQGDGSAQALVAEAGWHAHVGDHDVRVVLLNGGDQRERVADANHDHMPETAQEPGQALAQQDTVLPRGLSGGAVCPCTGSPSAAGSARQAGWTRAAGRPPPRSGRPGRRGRCRCRGRRRPRRRRGPPRRARRPAAGRAPAPWSPGCAWPGWRAPRGPDGEVGRDLDRAREAPRQGQVDVDHHR